jgi:multicomponent K+:H+ antiporter subunit E
MRLLLPYPIASASFLAFWLLLNQSLSLGHLLLGAAAGLVGGWSLAALKQPKARPRQLATMVRLAGLVFADIVRSNIAVARIILGVKRRGYTSGFVEIPLELRDPYGLATLACIITSTPGTLWVEFDSATGTLIIHVLDLIDKTTWVRTIKGRYERALLEIFA